MIYEDTPKYDLWLKLILGGVLALTLILGIIFIFQDSEVALVMFGVTLFDAAITRYRHYDINTYIPVTTLHI